MQRSSSRTANLFNDLLAGFLVALVLIPQSLAYAALAGMPAHLGLYAAALPPIAAAFFASSPFLQTGPTALIAILSYGVLAAQFEVGSAQYVSAAALLAVLVGLIRLGLGLFKLGGIAYFLSQPVLKGFTSGAALLILASQLPTALGVQGGSGGIVSELLQTIAHPEHWNLFAIGLSLVTLALMVASRRFRRFPGVLVAVLVGLGASFVGYQGPTVGAVPVGLPTLSLGPLLSFPWAALPELLLGASIIAVVGFAEPTAIARSLSEGKWNPSRELVSQGAANLAAGLFGAFPVGGSFARSSLNKLAGAKTRWSGFFTGLTVLAFLPFAGLLVSLPRAVLGAIIIGAVWSLFDLKGLLKLWHYAHLQALTAYLTFVLTLLLAPRIDYAVLLGIGAAIVAHLYRESQLKVTTHREGKTLTIKLSGVLWFVSVQQLEAAFREALEVNSEDKSKLIFDGTGLGRIDLSGNLLLAELIQNAESRGIEVEVRGLEPYMQRVLERVQEGN